MASPSRSRFAGALGFIGGAVAVFADGWLQPAIELVKRSRR